MISTRNACVVVLLLGVSLVPTMIHSYAGKPRSDGLSTAAIPVMLAHTVGTATDRDGAWGQRRLDAFDWFERRYGEPEDARLFVGRSLDAKQLYHHPELEIAYGHSFRPAAVQVLPGKPAIPVHVLRGRAEDSGRLALYVLLYDDRYVENPLQFEARNALKLLFSRRKPMTLFFVRQQLPTPDASIEASLAARLLVEAIAAFRAQQPQVPR